MPKVIFVPNTIAQVQKFSYVIRELPKEYSCKMLAIDRFKSDSTVPEMKSLGLDHAELAGMDAETIAAQLRGERADLAVVGNDVEVISRAVIDASGKAGIPNLLIQDGIICPHNYVVPVSPDFIPTALSIYGPAYLLTKTLPNMLLGKLRKSDEVYRYATYAGNVAAWGEYSKRMFVALGAKAANIHVTGAPAMDLSVKREGGGREEIFRKLGASPARKTLLFVPADVIGGRLYTRKEYRGMCDTVCGAVAGQDDMQMIIKPHPSFIRREPHFFDRYLGENIFLASGNPYRLLGACDALVAEISTMILEAIAFGLPVVVVNVTGRAFPCDPYPRIYVEGGVAILLDSKEKAAGALRSALFDSSLISKMGERRPDFIGDQLFRLDGNSAKRVADLIGRIIEKNPRRG